MTAEITRSRFLNLPIFVREKIYAYLLPYPEDKVTTINYSLEWSYLDNPSNNTFAGQTQIDLCTCPCEDAIDENEEYEPHIYTRYRCHGPGTRFKPLREGLWILQAARGLINILRPAAKELNDRPSAMILRVCRQVHDEALPFLYCDRVFFFLTGPCPRGRYQAYATLQWLMQLNPRARECVQIISLLVQPYEVDCNIAEVVEAYAELSAYIKDQLPRFKWLCLDVWCQRVCQAASVFTVLFDRQRVGTVVRKPWRGDKAEVFVTKEGFLTSLEVFQ